MFKKALAVGALALCGSTGASAQTGTVTAVQDVLTLAPSFAEGYLTVAGPLVQSVPLAVEDPARFADGVSLVAAVLAAQGEFLVQTLADGVTSDLSLGDSAALADLPSLDGLGDLAP